MLKATPVQLKNQGTNAKQASRWISGIEIAYRQRTWTGSTAVSGQGSVWLGSAGRTFGGFEGAWAVLCVGFSGTMSIDMEYVG